MKLYIPVSLLFSTVFLSTIHGSENNIINYTIRPYNDTHDHAQVFNMITGELPVVAGEKRAMERRETLLSTLNNKLTTNEPMSQVKGEEGSFKNTLFFDNDTLVAVATYLITKDVRNCFIDTVCISPKYFSKNTYKSIIHTVLQYAKIQKSISIERYESKSEIINIFKDMGFNAEDITDQLGYKMQKLTLKVE